MLPINAAIMLQYSQAEGYKTEGETREKVESDKNRESLIELHLPCQIVSRCADISYKLFECWIYFLAEIRCDNRYISQIA